MIAFLQSLGYSRRAITAAIKAWTLCINNQTITQFFPHIHIWDTITWSIWSDSLNHIYTEPQDHTTIALYKPVWYVCAHHDAYFPTIYELLPAEYHVLRYAGRLDKDSEWLVILSDDLQLIHRLTHPSYQHIKTYIVTIDRIRRDYDLIKPVCIDQDGNISIVWDILYAHEYKMIHDTVLEVKLMFGKKRHIRRLLKAYGYTVTKLVRTHHAWVWLWDLLIWQYKNVNPSFLENQ